MDEKDKDFCRGDKWTLEQIDAIYVNLGKPGIPDLTVNEIGTEYLDENGTWKPISELIEEEGG